MGHSEPWPSGTETENHPWRIRLVEHPKRFESSHFVGRQRDSPRDPGRHGRFRLPYGPGPWTARGPGIPSAGRCTTAVACGSRDPAAGSCTAPG
ncbi:DUF6424 family protein [Streptomyces sp. NPDC005132]|uniref:DUF6424 family protein n=1 Tax=Streptomyces sp. NPDC005132 TaxID=3154294 RepID=UPI00339EAB58